MEKIFTPKKLPATANALYGIPRGTKYYEARAAGFVALIHWSSREGGWVWLIIDPEGDTAASAPQN